MASILPIESLPGGEGGGKAAGLAWLSAHGFRIPRTWVVTRPDRQELERFVATLPPAKRWAIRSSAGEEDGSEASFAGQFESYLDVQGPDRIVEAVLRCFRSAGSERLKAYRREKGLSEEGMNVLIQEMIHPVAAGALFTVDPVNNRRDRLILSITRGTADGLMSGTEEGETHLIPRARWKNHACRLLPDGLYLQLAGEALALEQAYGRPADLEWAVNDKGELYWLQLRPVTGLKAVHLNELDDVPNYDPPLYTRANIGEMMPGPVTPLTRSTFGVAIDKGLQIFYRKAGVLDKKIPEPVFIHSFYNHLFFDLMALYELPRKVWLSTKENLDYSVVGEIVPGITIRRDTSFLRAFLHFVRVSLYMQGGPRAARRLERLARSFRLDCPDDPHACYRLITEKMQVLYDAYDLHYVSSSQSGGYFTTILNIFSGGRTPQPEHHQQVAALFTNIPAIEGAQGLRALDALARLLAGEKDIEKDFLEQDIAGATRYLEQHAPATIREAWQTFLQRHGHRCVREAELREKEWRLDPTPVIEGLKSSTKALLNGTRSTPAQADPDTDKQMIQTLPSFRRLLLRRFLPRARAAVARRERTKALAIRVQYEFKRAYRHLANRLVKNGYLPDPDLIFFLTHDELGKLLKGSESEKEKWSQKAVERRELYPEMMSLSFPDLSFGIPVPEEETVTISGDGLSGIPVSRGIAEGRVRLVRSMDEARKLQKGEIMVSRYTDIGWTPFYSLISGLITEIGSPLSHGAVVAREYNLPAVVSVKGALQHLKNGQRIRLDAFRGKVEILDLT